MSNPKKTHELIRQNEQIVKKSQKHDANLRKNSTLYFQVGLIVCLLTAYGLLEMTFERQILIVCNLPYESEDDIFVFNDVVKVYDEEVKEKVPEKNNSVIFENPIISEDDPNVKESLGILTEPTSNNHVLNPKDIKPVERIIEEDVIFNKVEQVPIYPGCENKKTNEDKRKCMSDKITQLVQKKFNTGLGGELGLSGKQTIRTQFKIDKTGHVTDIKVHGTHPELEVEAIRVINIIPEMEPGKQHDKNVGVVYVLPIVFDVQN